MSRGPIPSLDRPDAPGTMPALGVYDAAALRATLVGYACFLLAPILYGLFRFLGWELSGFAILGLVILVLIIMWVVATFFLPGLGGQATRRDFPFGFAAIALQCLLGPLVWGIHSHPRATAFVLAAAALFLFGVFGAAPVRFLRECLVPVLDPRPPAFRPKAPGFVASLFVLAGVLVFLLIGPSLLPPGWATLFLLAAPVLGVFVVSPIANPQPHRGLARTLALLLTLFQKFVAYSGDMPATPELSRPSLSTWKRQGILFVLLAPLTLLVYLQLNFCSVDLGGSGSFLGFMIRFPIALALPLGILALIYLPAVALALRNQSQPPPASSDAETAWSSAVESVRGSAASAVAPRWFHVGGEKVLERDHLYMGYDVVTGERLLVHRKILDGHAYVSGQTGSGKTAIGLTSLLLQLARPLTADEPPTPIVIIDLKGDLAFFNTVRAVAEERKQKMRYFTIEGGKDSYSFNPFANLYALSPKPEELAETLVNALSLNHGDYYGASYYSKQHRHLLLTALQALKDHPPETIRELFTAVSKRRKGQLDVTELLTTLYALSGIEAINLAGPPTDERSIFFPDVLKNGEIAYFHLPALGMEMNAREVGKLALFSLLGAARDYTEQNAAPRRVYVFIDEFQALAARNLSRLLQMARSHGVSFILASQDPRDVDQQPGVSELYRAVMGQTHVRQSFSVTDIEEIRNLVFLSGEKKEQTVTVEERESFPLYGFQRGRRVGEEWVPGLSPEDIQAMSASSNMSVVTVTKDFGLTQLRGAPRVIVTPWPLDEQTYSARQKERWPAAPRPAAVPTPSVVAPTAAPDPKRAKAGAMQQVMLDLIQEHEKRGGGEAAQK